MGCTRRIWWSGAEPWARGELVALSPKKRGRKPTPVDPRDRKIAELKRQLAHMTGRAERAEALVEARGCPKRTRVSDGCSGDENA